VAFAHIDRRQRQVHLRARGQGNRHQTAVFSTVPNRRKAAPAIAAGTRSRQPFGSAIPSAGGRSFVVEKAIHSPYSISANKLRLPPGFLFP
jgi:hypothetical protein